MHEDSVGKPVNSDWAGNLTPHFVLAQGKAGKVS